MLVHGMVQVLVQVPVQVLDRMVIHLLDLYTVPMLDCVMVHPLRAHFILKVDGRTPSPTPPTAVLLHSLFVSRDPLVVSRDPLAPHRGRRGCFFQCRGIDSLS